MGWLERLRGIDRPPGARFVIEEGYWRCARCTSLYGGILRKGPTRAFWTEGRERCRHDWRRVDRGAFLREASDRFAVDWKRDIPFFDPDR